MGCALISTLLACNDGIKFLESNKLLRQIADGLNQLDPVCNYHYKLFVTFMVKLYDI